MGLGLFSPLTEIKMSFLAKASRKLCVATQLAFTCQQTADSFRYDAHKRVIVFWLFKYLQSRHSSIEHMEDLSSGAMSACSWHLRKDN